MVSCEGAVCVMGDGRLGDLDTALRLHNTYGPIKKWRENVI